MKRAHAITYLQIAGYDDDKEAWTRLYIENRISYAAAKKAWAQGVAMRQAGVPRSMPK